VLDVMNTLSLAAGAKCGVKGVAVAESVKDVL
jgi:hypothetical protein